MTISMAYKTARELIQNGDVISVYASFSLKHFFPSVVRIFTGSPMYHVGLAVWMQSPNGIERLMVVESAAMGNGKRLIPLSYYENMPFDVTPCPGNFIKMEEPMLARIANQPYGFIDLLSIGLREFFGLKIGKLKTHNQVCSELVAEILFEGGVPLTNLHLSPGRLKSDLAKLGFVPTISVNM